MQTNPHSHPPVTLADIQERLEAARERCRELEEQFKRMMAEAEDRRQTQAPEKSGGVDASVA
jgi:hypothetical protein